MRGKMVDISNIGSVSGKFNKLRASELRYSAVQRRLLTREAAFIIVYNSGKGCPAFARI